MEESTIEWLKKQVSHCCSYVEDREYRIGVIKEDLEAVKEELVQWEAAKKEYLKDLKKLGR